MQLLNVSSSKILKYSEYLFLNVSSSLDVTSRSFWHANPWIRTKVKSDST